jgi:hypothetical protein
MVLLTLYLRKVTPRKNVKKRVNISRGAGQTASHEYRRESEAGVNNMVGKVGGE